jgi:hypothetical protein
VEQIAPANFSSNVGTRIEYGQAQKNIRGLNKKRRRNGHLKGRIAGNQNQKNRQEQIKKSLPQMSKDKYQLIRRIPTQERLDQQCEKCQRLEKDLGW